MPVVLSLRMTPVVEGWFTCRGSEQIFMLDTSRAAITLHLSIRMHVAGFSKMVAAEAARKAEQSPQVSPRTSGGEEAGDALERPGGHVARIDISRGGSLVSVEELASGGAETMPGHAMGGGWCGDSIT